MITEDHLKRKISKRHPQERRSIPLLAFIAGAFDDPGVQEIVLTPEQVFQLQEMISTGSCIYDSTSGNLFSAAQCIGHQVRIERGAPGMGVKWHVEAHQ
jgi:hypothetical protein